MGDRDLILIEKLDDENFISWKFKMQLLFDKRGCMDVDETTTEPTEKVGEDWRKWKKMESEAKYYIAATLEERLTKHIIPCKTSKEMWDTLCELYEKKTAARTKMLQKKLLNLRISEDMKVADYIVAEAKSLANQLKLAGDGVSDEML